MNKYNAQIGAGGTQYAYYHEEDESSFQLVSQLFLENIAAQMCLHIIITWEKQETMASYGILCYL